VYASSEAFAAMNKAQIESLAAVARLGFDIVERVSRLNLEAAGSLAHEAIAALRPVADGKAAELAAPAAVERLTGYSRRLLEILQGVQGEMLQMTDADVARFNREVLEAVEKSMLHSALPGGDTVLTGMRNAMGAATSSMDAWQQMFRQVTEFAEASLKAASPAANNTLKVVSRKRAA
jgi:hypothetical protein